MPLAVVIDWLRQRYALHDLILAPDRSACLQFGPLEVGLVPYDKPAGFGLRARIGEIGREAFSQQLDALLRANLFTDGVGASAFGMTPEGGIFLAQRFNETGLEEEVFLAALARFVRHALHWQAQLAPGTVTGAEALAHADSTDLLSPAALHAAVASPWHEADRHAWYHALARLLDARASDPDPQGACTLRPAQGPTIHLRRAHRPAVLQVAIALGEGYAASREQLRSTLMLSNRFLSEHADPHFALARHGREVVVCKAFRIEGPGGSVPLASVAQALGDIARIAAEFKDRLAGQDLLPA